MKKPNFFLVGAPKCGTTTLNKYLKSHPEIFMIRKESHYFNTDMQVGARMFTQLKAYLELYKTCKPTHLAVGEASVWYLFFSKALSNIYQFNENAKIIVMVRNPIEMTFSLFSQLRYNLQEDQESFEKAWYLQEIRKQGKMLPSHIYEPKRLQYGKVGRLGDQLERAYSIFPGEQIKVIVFDDFVTDTRRIYQETLLFLGISDDGRTEFQKFNKNKVYNIQWLHQFIQKPPKVLKKILNRWRYVRDFKNVIMDSIENLNQTEIQRSPLSDDFCQELADYFHDDVKKLSKLLDRDLMHWVE
ncbi:MAG: sulfotransferase [Candidatus Marithrix sp.]